VATLAIRCSLLAFGILAGSGEPRTGLPYRAYSDRAGYDLEFCKVLISQVICESASEDLRGKIIGQRSGGIVYRRQHPVAIRTT